MIIGISGCSRVGKNSFAKWAAEYFKSKNISCAEFALADELKRDLEDFMLEKTGISVWTDNTEAKAVIRPLMVEYGRIQRERTKGEYWIDKLRPKLEESKAGVKFITDIRYPDDEVEFVKSQGGVVIHITRFDADNWLNFKEEVQPANDEERRNDPRVKEKANFRFSWDGFSGREEEAKQKVWQFLKKNL